MELRRRRFTFRKIATILYIVAFLGWLIVGLQPADATAYEVSGEVAIPSINLISSVTKLELKENKLDTPDTIVGSYSSYKNKTFLIGHSSTVFKNLNQVKIADSIFYDNKEYRIIKTQLQKKSDVDMKKILKAESKDTLVVMTCAGEPMGNHDATHRLIITAVKV